MSDEILQEGFGQGSLPDETDPGMTLTQALADPDRWEQSIADEAATDVPVEPESLDVESAESHPSPTSDGYVEVDGFGRVPLDDVAELLRTREWIARNPAAWQDLIAEYEQRLAPPPQYEPEIPADEDEYEDPEIRALRQRYDARLEELEGRYADWEQYNSSRVLQESIDRFRSSHEDVDDDLMANILGHVHRTGRLVNERSMASAEEILPAAMEEAYRVLTYDTARTRVQRDMVATMRNRRDAAAMQSRARPQSRSEPEPRTPEERRQALIEAIRDAQSQQATN